MVAGSVVKLSTGWSAPSSTITTSSPASRSRAAATAPPAPLPTTTASAVNVVSRARAAPRVTFGYARPCSGGAVMVQELGAALREGSCAVRPVDFEPPEDGGMLVEGEHHERAHAQHERGPQAAGCLQSVEVALRLRPRHAGESGQPAAEQGRTELEQQQAEGKRQTERRGQVRKECLDPGEDVVVDRLIEAVSTRSDGGDRGHQDP